MALRDEAIRGLPTGDLIRRLINNASGIVDREVALAREEARNDVKQAAVGSGVLVAGGLFLYTAFVALVTTIIIALAQSLAPWVVALIVFAFFLIVGAILGIIGYTRMKMQPLQKTRETLREDVEWARNQTTSRGK